MSNSKDMIRHSINLLEYPLWFQDERLAEASTKGAVWKDLAGYVYRCGYKIPVKTDVIFLLYLLLQSQKADYAQKVQLSRYKIIQGCGLQRNSKWYARLEDSLERWKMVGIKFSGTFYDGNNYQAINFGVIDSWSIHEETKELKVVFSSSFIEMMLGKGLFKYINFSEFKQLRSPLATRLYEILGKSFHGRNVWEINADKLAEKIPMKERYPAHIIPKIKSAIARINKSTATQFEFTTRRSESEKTKTILCFHKIEADSRPVAMVSQTKPVIKVVQTEEMKAIIATLPLERQSQQTILETIMAFYEIYGVDYVIRNIRYTNTHAKNNYRSYLMKALQSDYGLAVQEDENVKQQITAQESQKAKEAATKEAEELRRRNILEKNKKRAQAYIEFLSATAKADLEAEVIANMPENTREIVQKKGLGSKILLTLAMENIALQKLAKDNEKQPVQPSLELVA